MDHGAILMALSVRFFHIMLAKCYINSESQTSVTVLRGNLSISFFPNEIQDNQYIHQRGIQIRYYNGSEMDECI